MFDRLFGYSTTNRRRHGAEAARPVLLTVSGVIPADLDDAVVGRRRPRADYRELARRLDADVVDYDVAVASVGRFGTALHRLLPDVTLAFACFRERRRREVVVTDNERVGLLLACLLRLSRRRGAVRHMMIAHRLSTPSKLRLHRLLRLGNRIDRVVVLASSQRDVATTVLGYPPDRVVLTPFMVDTKFWAPDAVPPSPPRPRPMICAVGQELRDYVTLAAAVRNIDADVVIAAASPWSKQSDDTENVANVANVEVVRLNHFDLRQLYADAALTVIPVVDTDYQAGITSILEAMAMQRAVICTRTRGQTDTVRDDETGRYVSPGDADELRHAIIALLGDQESATRLGAAGRTWVEDQADIEVYASSLAELVAALRAEPPVT